jgi:hypothetical protein
MAGGAAELVGSGHLDHHHSADRRNAADNDADDEERQHGPVHARPREPPPESTPSLRFDCHALFSLESRSNV